jgi:3',5'-nucleoside bisphosphate phosphatase
MAPFSIDSIRVFRKSRNHRPQGLVINDLWIAEHLRPTQFRLNFPLARVAWLPAARLYASKEGLVSVSAPCDLHMHTYYSDGRASPAELVQQAAKVGVQMLAITDHDNTRGAREAAPLAAQAGIELIPAIEFTCRWEGEGAPAGNIDIDLLGYFVDWDALIFQIREHAALDDIHARVSDLCAALTAEGHPITLPELLADNPYFPGFVQLIHVAIRKKNAANWDEAVAQIDRQWPAVRRSMFTIQEMIAAIHAAGGVAVLAHPTVITVNGRGWIGADHIACLVAAGLDGLEIYHHRLDQAARKHFLALAQQFGLLVSGGSDEHGWFKPYQRFGQELVTVAMVEALRARAAEHRAKAKHAAHGRSQASPG